MKKSKKALFKILHQGKVSILACYEEKILTFIFEKQEQGIALNIKMLMLYARKICDVFWHKTKAAQYHCIRRFVKLHNIAKCACTHLSKLSPILLHEEAIGFVEKARKELKKRSRNQHYIINIDQSPIYFAMPSSSTLNLCGAKTVNVQTSQNTSKRVTVAVTVSAAGDMLQELLIFKGSPKRRVQKEFKRYNEEDGLTGFYCCQAKAWMDHHVMLQWFDKVLDPYVQTAPKGVKALLF